MDKKIYFITGGGTGGHIYPAITIADSILENGGKVYYVGNPDNLESEIVKNKDYTFLPVKSSGMPRKATLKFLGWICRMFIGWFKCCCYIKKYKPDIIFGTGGYVSAPVLFAAITMNVPFVMHDCDANPGLVTRKLAPYAKSISVAFEDACKKLNNKNCYINGNPIRKEFSTLTQDQARHSLGLENKLTICIMGGSQGAKRINNATVEILEKLSNQNIQIIFQTGKRNYDDVIEKLSRIYPKYSQDKNVIIRPYFDNMTEVLKSSDIAVSRAGSLSISELCASSVASIFVPYPSAAADHQRKNAKYMYEHNAGLYLEDEDTTPDKLYETILSLINNPEKIERIKNNVFLIAKFDACQNILKQLES